MHTKETIGGVPRYDMYPLYRHKSEHLPLGDATEGRFKQTQGYNLQPGLKVLAYTREHASAMSGSGFGA